MTKRQTLALRGAAASAVATLVAALSHAWAGGQLPAPGLVIGMAVLLVAPGMALMGSRPRRGRIAASVLVLQGLFHGVFSLLGAPVVGERTVGGHHHGAASGAEIVSGWDAVVGDASAVSAIGGGMLLAHALAAAVTFVVLAYAERAILGVLAWAADWVRARAGSPFSPVIPRAVAPSEVRAPVARSAAAFVLVRGPPALAV